MAVDEDEAEEGLQCTGQESYNTDADLMLTVGLFHLVPDIKNNFILF